MFGSEETKSSVWPVSGWSSLLKVSVAMANSCWRPTWCPGEEAGLEQLADGRCVWMVFDLRGWNSKESE